MKLRGELKDLTQEEYLCLFERYVSKGGCSMRTIDIVTDEDMFIFEDNEGNKEIIEIKDYMSKFIAVEKCLYYGWI